MSSVFGVVRWDGGSVMGQDVAAMKAVLAPRSPEGFAQWQGGGVVIGYGHLDTTGKNESQSGSLAAGQLVVTADLRLDRKAELARQLGERTDSTDQVLLIAAYRRWGENCVDHLAGDFAFAIWDCTTKTLFCARDHLAARPLYYVQGAGFFGFASSPETLAALQDVPGKPHEVRLANLLVPDLDVVEPDVTWYKHIRAVMAGECCRLTADGNFEKRCYWTLGRQALLKLKDESEYVDAFIELFSRAVASRVNGADASMLLSGGIDSASIAATLCRLGKSIDSYSMVSPSEQSDPETEAIRLLQASTSIRGTGHSIATDQLAACLSELESIAWSHSDPVDNSILLSGLLANQAGRKHRVLLHGAAGDIVQGSFNRMPGKLMRQGRLIRAWRASADLSKNHTYSRHLGTGRIFLSNLWASFAPEPIRHIRTRLLINKQKKLKHVARLDILTPEYERSIQLREQLVAQLNDDFSPRPITEQDLWNYEEVKSLVQSANSGYERIASRAGMVARDPWADRDVIEFYCQLPPEVTAGHGWNKYLARLASAEELPAEVCWRKDKMHLGWHVIDQLLHGGSQSVMERLTEVRPWLAAYIRPEVLERLAAESLASDDEELVFDLLTAGYWLKRLDS